MTQVPFDIHMDAIFPDDGERSAGTGRGWSKGSKVVSRSSKAGLQFPVAEGPAGFLGTDAASLAGERDVFVLLPHRSRTSYQNEPAMQLQKCLWMAGARCPFYCRNSLQGC